MIRYYVSLEVRAAVTAGGEDEAYIRVAAALINRVDQSPGAVDVRGSDKICVTKEEAPSE